MTLDQLKTSYLFHLRTIITGPEKVELTRDIKAAERGRHIHKNDPLTRYEIHTLALRQDREGIIEQTELRAVGVTPRMRSRGIAYEKALNTHRDSEWDEE